MYADQLRVFAVEMCLINLCYLWVSRQRAENYGGGAEFEHKGPIMPSNFESIYELFAITNTKINIKMESISFSASTIELEIVILLCNGCIKRWRNDCVYDFVFFGGPKYCRKFRSLSRYTSYYSLSSSISISCTQYKWITCKTWWKPTTTHNIPIRVKRNKIDRIQPIKKNGERKNIGKPYEFRSFCESFVQTFFFKEKKKVTRFVSIKYRALENTYKKFSFLSRERHDRSTENRFLSSFWFCRLFFYHFTNFRYNFTFGRHSRA